MMVINKKDIRAINSLKDIVSLFQMVGFPQISMRRENFAHILIRSNSNESFLVIHLKDGQVSTHFYSELEKNTVYLFIASNNFGYFEFVKKESPKLGPPKYQKLKFTKENLSDSIVKKINALSYDHLESFEGLFDNRDIIQRVYRQFIDKQNELAISVSNIRDELERNRFAFRLMIRVMYQYFIQKHGLFHKDMSFLEKNPMLRPQKGDYFHVNTFSDMLSANKSHKEKQFPNMQISNDMIADLLTFFGKYRWNTKESVELGNDLTLSPAILGTIFEKTINSLSKSGRGQKETGAFYTPESITMFLAENTIYPQITDAYNERTHQNISSVILVLNKKKEIESCKVILQILDQFTILDNACGSGAFLLACLDVLRTIWSHTLFPLLATDDVLSILSPVLSSDPEMESRLDFTLRDFEVFDTNPHWQYLIKRKIIMASLYGVDIEQDAIEIIKIRFALSLFAEMEGDSKFIDPLPPLEHNLRQANSITTILLDLLPRTKNRSGFDVVIGNPPYGNILSLAEKNFCKARKYVQRSEASAIFIQQSFEVLKPGGRICYVVPKSLGFYNSWSKVRQILLASNLKLLLDLGQGFADVIGEQIAFISRNTPEITDEVAIHAAYPLRKRTNSKWIKFLGTGSQLLMQKGNFVLFRPFDDKEKQLLHLLSENSSPFTTLYQGKAFRGLYIPDKLKAAFQPGNTLWLNKVPDVKKYALSKLHTIDLASTLENFTSIDGTRDETRQQNKKDSLKRKIDKITRPRLILKVLRGNRLVGFLDSSGEILTTEKMINIVPKKEYVDHLFAWMALLNSPLPSFFLQKMVFSETTETSRVLDDPYISLLPIPAQIHHRETLTHFCQYLIILNSTPLYREKYQEERKYLQQRLIYPLVYWEYTKSQFPTILFPFDPLIKINFFKWWQNYLSNIASNKKDQQAIDFASLSAPILSKILEFLTQCENNTTLNTNIASFLKEDVFTPLEIMYPKTNEGWF
ncbi:Eco57I restriction-modification methylase domain-containing protein [Candidatus Lokiarchaeum ossiferum]|uniref:Eco57I restriction-modification methylase domain-containing protein n=1 Tax=Candidatus Lokiarchaeum ossiferum TaxID=2951803 RepID=UPI00352DE7B7